MLKLGLSAGAAGVLAAGGALYASVRREPTPGAGRLLLSDGEADFLAKIADVYFPPGNPIGVAATDVDLVGTIDAWMAPMPPSERGVVRLLFSVFDRWPQLSFSSSERFTTLPLEARTQILDGMHQSDNPAAQAAEQLLRGVVSIAFFDDDRTLAGVGHRYGCPI